MKFTKLFMLLLALSIAEGFAVPAMAEDDVIIKPTAHLSIWQPTLVSDSRMGLLLGAADVSALRFRRFSAFGAGIGVFGPGDLDGPAGGFTLIGVLADFTIKKHLEGLGGPGASVGIRYVYDTH